jgi:hypothetical protein
MHLRRRIRLRDEEGTTLVELLVGMGMGMVVLAGLAIFLIVTLHGNARVDARVEATDNARVTMTRIIEELHSGCVEPTLAPVQPSSTENLLRFKHGTYGNTSAVVAASQTSDLSEIAYTNEHTLTQTEPATSSKPRILLSNVSPIPGGEPVFSYWKYDNGNLKELRRTGLVENESNETILVKIAFEASPKSEPISDAGAPTAIRNSATLRLTPPGYLESTAKPCQ